MQQILQTVENASRKFMFGHVVLDEEKIAGFWLDGIEESVRFSGRWRTKLSCHFYQTPTP